MIIKNIWICGLGGVGGYFGGVIAKKLEKSTSNIYFLARGPHLNEIKKKGLTLRLDNGEEILCTPNLASDDVNDFPVPDLCLICVKSYDLDNLIISIRDRITDNTVIIPLMNGIDIYERIRKNLKKGIVLPTCVYIGSHIEKPGLVIQTGNPGFFNSGPDPQNPDFYPKEILDLFKRIEISMNWCEDPLPAIWAKYLLVASFALVSAHTGQTLGAIIDDRASQGMLREIMKEIIMIANKKGITLADNIIESTIEFCKDYPEVKPSYARDIEKGKINEGDLFGGTIIRMGKKLDIPTPITNSIYKENS